MVALAVAEGMTTITRRFRVEVSQLQISIAEFDHSNQSIGPVTDYGSSMVQWIRNRRPLHNGGIMLEAERPSWSYIVNVCSFLQKNTLVSSQLALFSDADCLIQVYVIDATTCCKTTESCRYNPSKTFTFITE